MSRKPHLLVCLGPGPFAERLLEVGARLARHLDAEWTAVTVDSPATAAQKPRLMELLGKAQTQGAETAVLAGKVVEAVAHYVERRNVSHIVLGKSLTPRWKEIWSGGSLGEKLLRECRDVDFYVIGEPPSAQVANLESRSATTLVSAPVLVLLLTLLGLPARGLVEPTNLAMLYLLGVVVAALRWGRTSATLVALLGVLALDVFFVPPYYRLVVADAQYVITFAVLALVGLMISRLADGERAQARMALKHAETTSITSDFARKLASAQTVAAVRETSERLLQRHLAVQVRVLPDQTPTSDDVALGDWGVLRLPESAQPLDPDRRHLLEGLAFQATSALERARLAERERDFTLLQEKERLQNALLNSISHDLKTPLVSITGALSGLLDNEDVFEPEQRKELMGTALEEAQRLNRYLNNLLEMTRLEADGVHIKKQPCDLEDLLNVAVERACPEAEIDLEEGLPLVELDYLIMLQVLTNLLDNARAYGEKPVLVTAAVRDEEVWIEVSDSGKGVPDEERSRIFDKFFRLSGDTRAGSGLGLSICRGFVEAHGGEIEARQSQRLGGLCVGIKLPLKEERTDG